MNYTEIVSKFNWAKTAGALIERFGGFSTRDLLGSENIHNPLNAMGLSGMAHKFFDELGIWLTPLEVGLVSRLRVVS